MKKKITKNQYKIKNQIEKRNRRIKSEFGAYEKQIGVPEKTEHEKDLSLKIQEGLVHSLKKIEDLENKIESLTNQQASVYDAKRVAPKFVVGNITKEMKQDLKPFIKKTMLNQKNNTSNHKSKLSRLSESFVLCVKKAYYLGKKISGDM